GVRPFQNLAQRRLAIQNAETHGLEYFSAFENFCVLAQNGVSLDTATIAVRGKDKRDAAGFHAQGASAGSISDRNLCERGSFKAFSRPLSDILTQVFFKMTIIFSSSCLAANSSA